MLTVDCILLFQSFNSTTLLGKIMACFIMTEEIIGGEKYGGLSPKPPSFAQILSFKTCSCYVGRKCNEFWNINFVR